MRNENRDLLVSFWRAEQRVVRTETAMWVVLGICALASVGSAVSTAMELLSDWQNIAKWVEGSLS